MRKPVLAVACLIGMAGLVVAAEVTLVRYDAAKKEVTVKEGEAEKTYKLTDKTKYTFVDQAGTAKDGTLEAAEKTLKNEKAPGKAKFDITTAGDTITEMKFKLRQNKSGPAQKK